MQSTMFPMIEVTVYHDGVLTCKSIANWDTPAEEGILWTVSLPNDADKQALAQYALMSAMAGISGSWSDVLEFEALFEEKHQTIRPFDERPF